MEGILGKKIGMTQVYSEDKLIPVTVVEAGPNFVIQTKTDEKEGYSAVKVGFDEVKEKNVTKPMMGVFNKAGIKPMKFIKEFIVEDATKFEAGQEFKIDSFEGVKFIDVVGTSKGKGFQGVMKRHNFGGGRKSHGASRSHRTPGSIGQSSTPSKVLKGTRMAGRMGGDRVTVQNLEVVKIDVDNNLLLVKGAVPGPKNGYLIIKPAKKK